MPLTPEQLAVRKVGASDVATIMGLNPYKNAVELYYEKIGAIEPADLSENEAVEAGIVLEDGIASLTERRMARRYGRPIKLRRCNLTLTHPKYDWLTVHIDRDVVGEERGVELKNVGWRVAFKWGAEGTDEIPDYYLPQPMTYMLVKNYPVWTVAGYFGGGELRLYEVERNKLWDEEIIESTHDFWHNHVLKGIPPELDYNSPRAIAALKRVYPGTDGTTQQAVIELEHWRDVRADAMAAKAKYEGVIEGANAHILHAMGESAILQFADGSAFTRKVTKRKGYEVPPCEFVDFRFKKAKEE